MSVTLSLSIGAMLSFRAVSLPKRKEKASYGVLPLSDFLGVELIWENIRSKSACVRFFSG